MGKGGQEKAAGGMARYTAFLRWDQIAALRERHARTGVPASEQIRRALDAALGTKPARKGERA